jgi:hypothetical protein
MGQNSIMSGIINLLNQIDSEEVVLPAIQRDFVWPQEKILKLLDSIMLYLDVLSGRENDDLAEQKYEFEFLTKEEAQTWDERFTKVVDQPSDDEIRYLIPVADLFSAGVKGRDEIARRVRRELRLDENLEARLRENLARFHDALTTNPNILKVSIIDENLPTDNPDRKTETDVLEIFVRINRLGTPLSRSDLIFSMLKLNWRESAETLPEFVRGVNEGNAFALDTDFVIRCLFAVSDLGTKFDLDLLRRKDSVERLRKNFQPCCDAIRSVVDFVVRECWCSSSNLIGGQATLVPFVYYLFYAPKHEVPITEIENLPRAFYVFAFSRPFSRYADSRLWKFIRQEIKPLVVAKNFHFPFESGIAWVKYWENITEFGERLLNQNVALTLHVVQDISTDKTQFERNEGQIDHIFPRAELRKKDLQEPDINHFGNFWILSKGKNQNKSDMHPAKFFEGVSDAVLRRAVIDRDMLDYRRYSTFIRERSEKIIGIVGKKTGLSSSDFADATE